MGLLREEGAARGLPHRSPCYSQGKVLDKQEFFKTHPSMREEKPETGGTNKIGFKKNEEAPFVA